MKHTYTAKAFINANYETVDALKAGRVIPVLTTGDGSFWTKDGYVEVGEATVTVKLFDGRRSTRSAWILCMPLWRKSAPTTSAARTPSSTRSASCRR